MPAPFSCCHHALCGASVECHCLLGRAIHAPPWLLDSNRQRVRQPAVRTCHYAPWCCMAFVCNTPHRPKRHCTDFGSGDSMPLSTIPMMTWWRWWTPCVWCARTPLVQCSTTPCSRYGLRSSASIVALPSQPAHQPPPFLTPNCLRPRRPMPCARSCTTR